jgi:hypothetical protein
MANNPVFTSVDDTGNSLCGARTATIAAAGTAVVKASPGRLCRVLVTATGTGAVTFYDNPSAASGTVIGVVPASAAVGAIYEFQAPAAAGITASAATTPSSVTVIYS